MGVEVAAAGFDVGDVGEVDDAFGVVGFMGNGLPCFYGEGEGRGWAVGGFNGCWSGGREKGEGGERGDCELHFWVGLLVSIVFSLKCFFIM